jgi:Uma2 family endonuclease
MASAALISIGEYLTTVYHPDCEYVDGEVLERNAGESDHAGLQGLLTAWFLNRRRKLGIHVFPELRVQVAPARFRIPDITVTTRKVSGQILNEPPFLCIEILSPEDRATRLEEKIDDYLRFGTAHVWVIDPRQQRAWSYSIEGKRETVTLLTTVDPTIELPIDELFQELEGEIERPERQ